MKNILLGGKHWTQSDDNTCSKIDTYYNLNGSSALDTGPNSDPILSLLPWLGPFMIFQTPHFFFLQSYWSFQKQNHDLLYLSTTSFFFFLLSYWSFQNNTSVYTIHLHHDFNVWEHSRSWLWPSMFKKSMILQEVSMTKLIIFPTNHQEWVHGPRSLFDPYNDISYHKEWVHSYMNYARAPFVLQLNKSSYVGKSIIVHNKFACILNYLYKK